jgi:TetR/AcrR family transcriptional regulator, regulator of cefoperazone and chloramphenicol sensitivity
MTKRITTPTVKASATKRTSPVAASKAGVKKIGRPATKTTATSPSHHAGARERLLAAALAEFGTRGFDGTTARHLSAIADAPLSAIPYHFGTMESLYRETVAQVLRLMGERLGPAVSIAEQAAISCKASQAKAAIQALLYEIMRVVVVSEESTQWAKLLMREMQTPSLAIVSLQEDIMFRAHRAICGLIHRGTGKDLGSTDVALQAFALLGQVIVFRHIQPIVRLRMGWPRMGDYELELLKKAIRVEL